MEGLIVLSKGYVKRKIIKKNSIDLKVPNLLEFKRYNKDEIPKDSKEVLRTGIYALILRNQITYIGLSRNFQNRIKCHKRFINFDSYLFYSVPKHKKKLLDFYEKILIIKYKPILNKDFYYCNGRYKL